MSDAVEDKITEIVVDKLGVEKAQVVATASYADDLNADSLDIAELVMALEEEFELTVPENADIKTVGETFEYIKKELAKKGAGAS
jgi:acyl carrier protein